MATTDKARLNYPTAIPEVHARASELYATTFFPEFSWLERTFPYPVMAATSFL